MDQTPLRSPAAVRRAIRRQWDADGRPPCPICDTSVSDDEVSNASQERNAVVHRICATAVGLAPAAASAMVVAARTAGLPIIEVPTASSPGCERAARAAGVGTHYEGVSRRQVYGDVPNGVLLIDPAAWDKPSNWYEPPATLILDVDRSFRESRIAACVPQDEAREAWRELTLHQDQSRSGALDAMAPTTLAVLPDTDQAEHQARTSLADLAALGADELVARVKRALPGTAAVQLPVAAFNSSI